MSDKPQRNSTKKTISGNQQVLDFLDKLQHPLQEEIEEVRRIILSADERFTEHIKWNAPSFCIGNEDRITFNLKGKGFFRLVFHCGAKVKPKLPLPLFDDHTGILEWQSNDRAVVRFLNMDDVKDKEENLRWVIGKWIETSGSS
ncbi:DUF1801 domain-containing protein [Bacillus lacus]|uniref:DUF1801 domain-containing protein n=1 Tax=Metabacillus lacus TaxID=1983721 RepID=A0A7X2J1P2_9BACI|nr:DUF1801 domain-containing protein [Metabacillus lacus]MRX73048.1 DUF1801 domain-containing protein [Metabacillus lacus]